MKIAAMKEEGRIPGGGFHYMLVPFKMDNDMMAAFYEQIGYVVFEVEDSVGEKLLGQARAALSHQIQVAHFVEQAIVKRKKR